MEAPALLLDHDDKLMTVNTETQTRPWSISVYVWQSGWVGFTCKTRAGKFDIAEN